MNATPKQKLKPLYQPDAVSDATRLLVAAGTVTELRALDAITKQDRWPHTASGYFDDFDKLTEALQSITSAKGIYIIPNTVDPALLARASNRIRKTPKGESTQDTNITWRRWLLIDTDPQRPSGISATDAEHEAALEHARAIYAHLKGCGWPAPIAADSGNGAHLLYPIDLPTDDGGIVQRCLNALAERFDTDAVKVDQTVFNPSRIWKLYGTLACKGDDTPDRPHRMSCILSRPDELKIVDAELLEALAGKSPDEPACERRDHQNGSPFDLESFIARHHLEVEGPEDWNGRQGPGKRWTFVKSPMCDHDEGAAHLEQHTSGAISAGCHHSSCSWTWGDLRDHFEPRAGGKKTTNNSQTAKPDRPAGRAEPVSSNEAAVSDQKDLWPDPLAEEAYYGLTGEIVRKIEPHSEADPVAILSQVLLAFGNLIGRSAHFRAEADKHYGNLFATLVGVTSKGRKGTSWGQVRRLVALVAPDWCNGNIAGGLSSGEGLIWGVRDPIKRKEPIREGGKKTGKIIDYQEVIADEGVDDKRLLVMESEFASVLQVCAREKNTLSAIMRQAWDTGRLRTMTKNSPACATDAHISIVGHITRDELRRLITATDMANGLANRFLWLCVRRSKSLPEGGNLRDNDLAPLAARLQRAVQLASDIGEVRRDDKARAIWREVYGDLSAGKTGLLGAATSRAESQVMRLALLYALLDESTVICAEHLTAALAVWQYAEQSAKYIFGSALGDPVADGILRALRRLHPDGMTRTDIRDLFQKHRTAGEIGEALELLADCGLARCEMLKTEGRPAEVWFSNA